MKNNKEHKTDNSEQLKTAINLLKNVRRELIDYHGLNNAVAIALYVVIKKIEENENEGGENVE